MVFLQDDALSAPQIFDKDVKSPRLLNATEKAGSLPEEWPNLDPFWISNERAFFEDKLIQTEDSEVKTVEKELGKSF